MTKILKNKTLRRWFSVLLAFLLVVTLAPSFQAFGTDEGGKTDITTQEEGSDLTVSGVPEDTTNTEQLPVVNDVPADTTDGNPSPDGVEDGVLTAQETEDQTNPDEGIVAQREKYEWVTDAATPTQHTATVDTDLTTDYFTKSMQAGHSYKLTISGTLKGDSNSSSNPYNTIMVPAGASLTIDLSGNITNTGKGNTVVVNGDLTIVGNGNVVGPGQGGQSKASVILVTGKNAKLTVGNKDSGPTIKEGSGTSVNSMKDIDKDHKVGTPLLPESLAGGGIHVERSSASKSDTTQYSSNPTLIFNNGTISNNEAQAGGGIYIDRWCNFTMMGGTVRDNTATTNEGGGIYIANPEARIISGNILSNHCATESDWGGGGIFVESQGKLYFKDLSGNATKVLITGNSANGLGGGISGCPHAASGIGPVGNNALAIYGNTAAGANWLSEEDNKFLWENYGKGDFIAFGSDKENFTPDKAQDFYCTYASVVYPQGYEVEGADSWTGRLAYADKKKNRDVTINKKTGVLSVENASLGLTAAAPAKQANESSYNVVIKNNTTTMHGGGIGSNGVVEIGTIPDEKHEVTDWSLPLKKSYQKVSGEEIAPDDTNEVTTPTFTFGVYKDEKCTNPVTIPVKNAAGEIEQKDLIAKKDGSGKILFNFAGDEYKGDAKGKTYTFYIKELAPSDPSEIEDRIDFDDSIIKVEATVKTYETGTTKSVPWQVTTITSTLEKTKFFSQVRDENGKPVVNEKGEYQFKEEKPGQGNTFTNVYHPQGSYQFDIAKYYYGESDTPFDFSIVGIPEPQGNMLDLSESLNDLGMYKATTDGQQKDSTTGKYQIKSEKIMFTSEGSFWFLISENELPNEKGISTDPRIYVAQVETKMSDDWLSLTPTLTKLYYAESVEYGEDGSIKPVELTGLDPVSDSNGSMVLPEIRFNNFDTSQSMSVAGYSVNAASNEPLEEVCFVDPKIVKNLEGRTLKADEFNFKLIHLNKDDNLSDDAVNWSVTEGPVISETSNDRYGMVDFDAANNVSGNWENPSCLSYTQPGIYHYRVVEANDTVDPSVDYSKQIITFTTVIEYNAQGQLECTDMYYGYVDGNGYHRYTSKADDPTYEASDNWHPTMTNTAKTMTLKVQKTSALDRNRGLEGATYGLYAVNEGVQDDILIGEETSDKEGWITFENLSLNTAATYYFKERYAPAGHTVSEFRSPYFKVSQGADGYKVINIEDNAQAQSEDEDIMAMAEEDAAAPANDEGITIFAEGVYDEATLVEFAKLDARTHEWVEGADLSIINKSTGEVVNRWTSGKANERLEGVLNVDTTYILRENAAPEGYAKADDVEFTIDQYGSVHVISGTGNNSAGLANAVLQDSTISLYDTMLDAEQVVTETRETPGQDDGGFLAKTGDFLKVTGIAALAVIALLGLIYAVRRARGQEN